MAQKEIPQGNGPISQHKQMAQGKKDQVPVPSIPSPFQGGKK